MSDKKLYQFPRTNTIIPLEGDFRNAKGIKVKHRVARGEASLLPKEQSADAVKDYLAITTNPLAVEDPLTQQFLDLMIKDGYNIKLYDPAKDAQVENDNIELSIDALAMVKSAPELELIPVAYDTLGKESLTKSPEEIRKLLYGVAGTNPQSVLDSFGNKDTNKVKYFIAEAFGHGLLDTGFNGSEVIFTENGERLVTVSKGETAIDAVAEHFSTKEGKPDYHVLGQTLAKKLGRDADEAVKKTVGKPTTK